MNPQMRLSTQKIEIGCVITKHVAKKMNTKKWIQQKVGMAGMRKQNKVW